MINVRRTFLKTKCTYVKNQQDACTIGSLERRESKMDGLMIGTDQRLCLIALANESSFRRNQPSLDAQRSLKLSFDAAEILPSSFNKVPSSAFEEQSVVVSDAM